LNVGPTIMLDKMDPLLLADPYPFYRTLYDRDPVLWVDGLFGVGAWVVTSHAVASAVLRDKSFGKDGSSVLPPEKLALIPAQNETVIERRRNNMLFCDPPTHTRLRSLVAQTFTPRTVERLRPRIAEITRQLLDNIDGVGTFDLLATLAFPLPVIVIAELLGVPPEDRDRFKEWSTVLTRAINPAATAEDFQAIQRVLPELDGYLSIVIEERRREPRFDLISDLVLAHEAGDRLNMEELLATCRLILSAGHETTMNFIGNGVLALLRHDEQRARLADDPSLLPNAVEELLRYDSPVQMTVRFAFADAALGERAARRGDLVLLLLGAANRDPAQFRNGDALDLARDNASTHLAFGGGIHYCLGAALARIEGEQAIGALFARFPSLRLGAAPLGWRHNFVLRGLETLPVTVAT
jgi:cytochrome P450